MARYETANVNPDLSTERRKATFDQEALTNILNDGKQETKRRREIEHMIIQDKIFDWPDYHFMDRNQKYDRVIQLCNHFAQKLREMPNASEAEINYLTDIIFPNIPCPLALHLGMFMNVVEEQTTKEQKEKWLPMAKKLDIISTYAQTELGHGTHVRGLETTATYDRSTEEFVVHSPTLTSTKFWPGGLGKTANHALVMAQLYTQGKCQGVQPFIVQLRDIKTHEPLPGITVGDIGPKFGFETIDNGFLCFTHVRIPRENMVMRNAKVEKDGRFVISPSSNSQLTYGAMVNARAGIVGVAGKGLAKAVTIAIRYSCVRQQSELKPGDAEPKILDFQTQQYKLLPWLATAYAFRFTGLRMMKDYNQLNKDILSGNLSFLPELHASSSGLKALTTYAAMVGIEQCRLACGGHGYSMASGLPTIYVNTVPCCTLDGDNTVLYLQTARYLMKVLQQVKSGSPVTGSVSYLSKRRGQRATIDSRLQIDSLIEAYEHRAASMTEKAGLRLSQLQAQGKPLYEAWNMSAVMLVKAAECHCYVYTIEAFACALSKVVDRNVKAVLAESFQLYALYGITTSAADFMQDGYLTGEQLEIVHNGILSLFEKLRPNALALVDAFDFHDRALGSILGRYDGNVYENIYKWAADSPLNKKQVHKSYGYLKQSLQPGNQSKL